MSDRICLMNGGKIEQLGTPGDLYFHPRTLFVADFIGDSNLLPAVVTETSAAGIGVALDGGRVKARASTTDAQLAVGQPVRVMVRPQNLRLAGAGEHAGHLSGRVLDVMVVGSMTKLYLDSGAPDAPPIVAAYATGRLMDSYRLGEMVSVQWQEADAVAIAE
jgi:putative spermidine/putrescine transport system ATP-binding protein